MRCRSVISTVSDWGFPCSFEMFKYLFLVQNAWYCLRRLPLSSPQRKQKAYIVASKATALLSYFGLAWAKGIELDMASGTKPAPPLLATWVQVLIRCEVGNVYGMRYFEATSQKRLPLTDFVSWGRWEPTSDMIPFKPKTYLNNTKN